MIEIVVMIFGMCYVFCMLWIVVCEYVEDFVLDVSYSDYNFNPMTNANPPKSIKLSAAI